MDNKLLLIIFITFIQYLQFSSNLELNEAKSIVYYINKKAKTTWKAAVYPARRRFYGRWKGDGKNILPMKKPSTQEELQDIPESFDSRKNWPGCMIMHDIRDQGACGSCWAVSTASVLSDRICAFKGGDNVRISSEDINDCSGYGGCHGGFDYAAFQVYVRRGYVTGGPYGSQQGCKPYTIKPCDHHINGTHGACGRIQPTPRCSQKCRSGYKLSYQQDKHFGTRAYRVSGGVREIQNEIMKNGPVVAAFVAYKDFETYKSGIYQHKTGGKLGGHAVKMLGWGVENGTNYWIIANSWNSEWGEHGYFRILRGVDECGIESSVSTATPKL